MSEDKPELMTLVWKLYNLALRLAEELEEPELDEKQRKWKFDALSKVTSPLVKLLQMALEEGEVREDDLVKLLSGLSSRGLMSFEEMYSVFEKRIEEIPSYARKNFLTKEGKLKQKSIIPVMFVPLLGPNRKPR